MHKHPLPFGADHQSHEHDPAYELEKDWEYYQDRLSEMDLLDPQPTRSLGAEKVRYTLYNQYLYSCMDSVSVCQFVFGPAWQLYGPSQLVDAVRGVTGWNVSLWELLKVGERRLNLMRAFNGREGVGAEADTVPPKLLVPLQGGKSDGVAVTTEEVETAKSLYYRMAGWDESGRPTRGKLEELAMGWVVEILDL